MPNVNKPITNSSSATGALVSAMSDAITRDDAVFSFALFTIVIAYDDHAPSGEPRYQESCKSTLASPAPTLLPPAT